ncbi:hypothetical protein [Streptomyces kaempferi]|uniref:Uncharacterized protein n=1 Tax=Streptomyces kaempferi TaxID=333725 RepID=A0ABW3XXX2_9ACTN
MSLGQPGSTLVQDNPALSRPSARYDAYTSYRRQHNVLTLFDIHSVPYPQYGANAR